MSFAEGVRLTDVISGMGAGGKGLWIWQCGQRGTVSRTVFAVETTKLDWNLEMGTWGLGVGEARARRRHTQYMLHGRGDVVCLDQGECRVRERVARRVCVGRRCLITFIQSCDDCSISVHVFRGLREMPYTDGDALCCVHSTQGSPGSGDQTGTAHRSPGRRSVRVTCGPQKLLD